MENAVTHADLDWLLRAPLPESSQRNLADWLANWRCLVQQHEATATLAMRGGFLADRLGWAFAAGYQAAMRAAFSSEGAMTEAFCATETGGMRPRELKTTLVRAAEGWVLEGAKGWSTFGDACDNLLVVARDTAAETPERAVLRVVRVPASAPGVAFNAQPPLPFISEVPHTAVTFSAVAVADSAVLPGDGYNDYLKPFRTVEDVHVTLAMLAHGLREIRRVGDSGPLLADLAAGLLATSALVGAPPLAPTTHLLLDAVQTQAGALYARVGTRLMESGDAAASRWQRDTPVFKVAAKARARRAQRAREQLGLN